MEDRPARRQVTEVVTTHASSHDMMTYNIWSHRGNRTTRREGRGKIIKSEYRCHSALDCGWTRGERAGTKFICIYFARGVCHHGSSCNYVHRVPGADFELYHRTQPQYDIFGRDRSLDIDASTKGAGSLNRDCTTLYLYLGALASLPDATVEKMVRDDFEEWGEIEEINIVSKKAVGFVRYILRSASEFAKAAMHQQQLRGDTTTGTVLDIRWAHDDPNPVAIARVKEKQEKMLADAYMAAIERLPDGERAAKLQEIALSQAHTKDAVTSAYPNTSHQYNNNNDNSTIEDWWGRGRVKRIRIIMVKKKNKKKNKKKKNKRG